MARTVEPQLAKASHRLFLAPLRRMLAVGGGPRVGVAHHGQNVEYRCSCRSGR